MAKAPGRVRKIVGAAGSAAGAGIQKGFQKRVERISSGESKWGRRGGGSESAESSHKKVFPVIFILIVVGIVLFWASPLFGKLQESGVLETKGGRIVKPVVEVAGVMRDTLANTGRTLGKYLGGEYVENLESGVIEKTKSGFEFGDIDVSGIEFGGLVKNLRANTKIIVGEFDEKLETVTAKVGCELKPDDIKGIPGGAGVGADGEVVLEHPPKDPITGKSEPGEKEGIKCSFPHEKVDLPKKLNAKEIEMMLTYTLLPDFSLEVLGMRETIASEEEEKKLSRGNYDRFAKMRYITDVVAKMHFSDKKPLLVGDTKILGMQFENKEFRKNKVALQELVIVLPETLQFELDKCDPLDITSRSGKLKEAYIQEINSQLNKKEGEENIGDGESDLYECVIRAPSELGSVGDIVPLGSIKGKMKVTNTVSKKESVTIYRKDETNVIAEANEEMVSEKTEA